MIQKVTVVTTKAVETMVMMETVAAVTTKANGNGDKDEDGDHEESRSQLGLWWTQLQPCGVFQPWELAGCTIRAFLRETTAPTLSGTASLTRDDSPSLSHTDSKMDRAPMSTVGLNCQHPGPRPVLA